MSIKAVDSIKVERKAIKMIGYDYAENFQEYEGLIKSLAYKAYIKISHVNLVDLEDLINDGHIYMLQVSEKFDRTRGVKFSTFMTDALSKFYINSVKYHYRECRKGNLNARDVDEYIPNADKDEHLIYEIPEEGLDEETRYSKMIAKGAEFIEEKDLSIYLLMAQEYSRKEIMEKLDIQPWTYANATKRIRKALAPLVGRAV